MPEPIWTLLCGRHRGFGATATRGLLSCLEVPYASGVRLRNYRYDRGHATIKRVGVPVISVGNLTMGGTGKTPMVKWIARWFSSHHLRVALVSRGYGSSNGQLNDEARELAAVLPHVPHVQNPDRVAAAQEACRRFDAQVIVADDAFQHRRLARDLDIVLIDACEPFGFGHIFPRGTLREPVQGPTAGRILSVSRVPTKRIVSPSTG